MIGLTNAFVPEVSLGLSINVGHGTTWFGGSNIISVGETNVALTPNTTNFIFISTLTANIQVNTSGFITNCIPIATVITTAKTIFSLVDNRPDFYVLAGGGASPNFADAEVPTGVINGINSTFTLAHTPNPSASLALYVNGVLQDQNVSGDYTLAANTISFTAGSIPQTGDFLEAFYRF